MTEFFLREDFADGELAAVRDPRALYEWASAVAGTAAPDSVYRRREGRITLRFDRGQRGFFLKLHRGVGWREICKNLLQGRLPVLGAGNEYRAVRALERAGVATLAVAAYAQVGMNPARRRSLLVSDELAGTVSLEDYCAHWSSEPPPPASRFGLIRTVADMARRMHGAGVNHRDFYLCHFHLDQRHDAPRTPHCYLIDLHRAQLRRRTPRRWRIKDLAGLYFSAMDSGLTERDLLRFLRHYCAGGLRQALGEERWFWRRVRRRALRHRDRTGGPQALRLEARAHGR